MAGGTGDNKALAFSLKLLGYRMRSQRELRQRLSRKGFTRTEEDEAIAKLVGLGYIDDAATARALRDQAERVKLLGHSGARNFLWTRGIGKEDSEQALEGYDEEAAALKLLERKQRALAGLPIHVARRRLAGYLGRRGFSGESLSRMLRLALDEEIGKNENDTGGD